MKILIASDVYFPTLGGIPVVVKHLSQELSKNDHDIVIVVPSPTNSNYEETEGKVTVNRIGSFNLVRERAVRIPIHFLRFEKIIKSFKPDIIHIMTPNIIGIITIIIAKRLGIPTIGTGHVLPENILSFVHWPPIVEKISRFVLNKFLILVYRQMDSFTVPSRAAKTYFTSKGLQTDIRVISNGLFIENFQRKNKDKQREIIKKYKLSGNPYIFYLGRIDREKQIDILIKAVALLHSPHELILIGKGLEQKYLEDLCQELKVQQRVRFLGYVPDIDVPAFYQSAQVYVMPSDIELQSISTIEAMASGLPVIGANALALPNLIEDGRNGFLFTPSDEHELAKKLNMVLGDEKLRIKMGKESEKLAEEHDMHRIVKQMETAYREAVEQKTKK